MNWSRAVTLAIALAVPTAAAAQHPTLPWPDQQKPQAAPDGPAWPGDRPAGGAAPAPMSAAPAPMSPAPMRAPPAQMMGMPGGGGGMPGGGAPGGGMGQAGPSPQQVQCMNEFGRLRTETEKRGDVARQAGERKVAREEMCKHITNLFAAESKWYKYAVDHRAKCGIPPQIIQQLKVGHNQLATVRKNVCSADAPMAAAPPSLSEALGTSALPLPAPSTSTRRGGALDTLTGSPIR